jgi:nickel-type superoxide dismutase maturation protease
MRDARWFDRILVLLRLSKAVRVSGSSMRPTLDEDDVVIIRSLSSPLVGDVVLVDHPFKKSVSMVKRVAAIAENGRVELRGDNPDESTDSRTFGSVPIEYIKGKAVCRLKRNDRGKGTSSTIS